LVLPLFHHFECDLPAELPTAYTGRIAVDCESEYDVEEAPLSDVSELPYPVYCHLKARGDCIRNGNNYGADFSIYRSRPRSDHSIALVWCQNGNADARKVVQDVRIAESATKSVIVAVGGSAGVRHVNVRTVNAEQDRLGEEKELSQLD
jgi:tRNA splicing endonuclease